MPGSNRLFSVVNVEKVFGNQERINEKKKICYTRVSSEKIGNVNTSGVSAGRRKFFSKQSFDSKKIFVDLVPFFSNYPKCPDFEFIKYI